MKQQYIKTLNPISWLLFGLGACSASTKVQSIIPPLPQATYAFTCKSGTETIGISDLGGAAKIYKENVLLFSNHRGSDLSMFFVTQYPSETLPMKAFSMLNETPAALENFALNLEMDLASGELSITEDRFIRDTPGGVWQFDSSAEFLKADSCVVN